ncbi:MAG: hypothetical protein L3K02_05090 [Thermoplasmata archaeon]|nr:hypothetical protein [Thermoplasmata archaeon]
MSFLLLDGTGTGGTVVYNLTDPDPETGFEVNGGETLTNGANQCSYAGFTDYQEVWGVQSSQKTPNWNFGFLYTYAGTTEIVSSDWSNDSSGGSNIAYPPHHYIYDLPLNYQVRIDNEAFGLYYPSDSGAIAPGGTFSTTGGNTNAAGSYCSGSSCPFTVSCTFTSYGTGSDSPGSGYVPQSSFDYSVTMSASTPTGVYYPGCTLTETGTSPSEFTLWIFYVQVS